MQALGGTIQIPETYVTSPSSHVRIANHPESVPGATPIIVVTLNRPEKLNAFTGEMIADLEAFFRVVNRDSRVKVVVLTGAGRAFSAGIDLNLDSKAPADLPLTEVRGIGIRLRARTKKKQIRDIGGRLALAMYNCTKTIIVAYNGLAVGIGMTSTLAAGIR